MILNVILIFLMYVNATNAKSLWQKCSKNVAILDTISNPMMRMESIKNGEMFNINKFHINVDVKTNSLHLDSSSSWFEDDVVDHSESVQMEYFTDKECTVRTDAFDKSRLHQNMNTCVNDDETHETNKNDPGSSIVMWNKQARKLIIRAYPNKGCRGDITKDLDITTALNSCQHFSGKFYFRASLDLQPTIKDMQSTSSSCGAHSIVHMCGRGTTFDMVSKTCIGVNNDWLPDIGKQVPETKEPSGPKEKPKEKPKEIPKRDNNNVRVPDKNRENIGIPIRGIRP